MINQLFTKRKLKSNKLLFLISGVLMCSTIFITSCEPDEQPPIDFIERDRLEQQEVDKDLLLEYLNSHYYNSSVFSSGMNYNYEDIVISELDKDSDDNYIPLTDPNFTMLIDAVEVLTTEYKEVEYEYYILKLNQGGGEAPKFTDRVRVRYEGSLVTGGTFQSISTPTDLSLTGVSFSSGSIVGWQRIIPQFNSAINFSQGNDGVVNYNDYGLGVMFIPSGLAYFSSVGITPEYSNLIFKFELLQTQVNDHDFDGIPSYVEDLDNDLDLFDEDIDEDNFPNYIDIDDDGDGILTINEHTHTQYPVDTNIGEMEPVLSVNEYEISRSVDNGVITINTITLVDSNSDGTFDYLDADIAVDNNVNTDD